MLRGLGCREEGLGFGVWGSAACLLAGGHEHERAAAQVLLDEGPQEVQLPWQLALHVGLQQRWAEASCRVSTETGQVSVQGAEGCLQRRAWSGASKALTIWISCRC